MGFVDNAKKFLMDNKIGAIAGAALAIPAVLAAVSFLSFVNVVFVGGSIGFGDTVALILNVLIGAFLGAGVQYLLRDKLNIG